MATIRFHHPDEKKTDKGKLIAMPIYKQNRQMKFMYAVIVLQLLAIVAALVYPHIK